MHNANHNSLPAAVLSVKRFAYSTSFLLLLLAVAMLSACGGGADNQSKPAPANGDEIPIYTGSLKSDDVKAFKKELWEKLRPRLVCGKCHRPNADPSNRQSPYFVDWLDVNLAYDVVVEGKLVDLVNPANSVLVQRVANGHHCWSSKCKTKMIGYIEAWANGSKKGTTSDEFLINPLNESQIHPPGQSLFFPIDAPASYSSAVPNIHTLVTTYCAACHISTVQNAQSPFFAEEDVAASYQAIKTVINLNDPAASRVYERLSTDSHNCWDDCAANAATMLQAIQNLAASISPTEFAAEDAVSKALTMLEGTIASSHNRYESSQIALYEFKSGSINPSSDTIYDTSGVEPEINLSLYGNDHRWLSNWGIEFTASRGAMASSGDSRKLYNLIRLTGEYSLEAWVIPANVNQEDASIVAYSGGSAGRNFTLGQTLYNYDFFQRSSTLGADGQPRLMTNDDDEDLQTTLQHVVITYSQDSGRRIYINGNFTGDIDPQEAGDLLNWHPSYVLSFGNEPSNTRAWDGIIRMVAIHDRVLTDDQIQQNYLAEVGEKYQVPFYVSDLVGDGVPHSYVVFEVSLFDEYSYLFRNPRFINLDPASPDYVPPATALSGIRIGMNGQDVSVGQAYTNVSIDDISQGYSTKTGLILSGIDTILQIQNGASDEFFLTFKQFNGKTYSFVENDQTTVPALPTVTEQNKPSDIGLRTFDEINASMAQMTGITNWQTVTKINDLFTTYRTQLPAVANIEAFQGSQQMAIAQLAMTYCDEVVENTPGYFPGFIFDPVASAFDTAIKVDQIINPLLSKMFNASDYLTDNINNNLTTQPSVLDIRNELTWLINGDGGSRPGMVNPVCSSGQACIDRTKEIVKATCAAALGSAAMLIQ